MLRYAQKHDKLLYEYINLYYLDHMACKPATTFLRPKEATLKKLISDIKPLMKEAPDGTKYVKQREEGLRYVLKGAIIEIRATHRYVSFAEYLHYIYKDGNKISILDEPTDDPKQQMSGAIAELITITTMNNTLYQLKDKLPQGTASLKKQGKRKPRIPIGTVLTSSDGRALMVGGGTERFAPNGVLPKGFRRSVLEELKKKDNWERLFPPSIIYYLTKNLDSLSDANVIKLTAIALVSGVDIYDTILLLEPFADGSGPGGIRPGLDMNNRKTKYLIPDVAIAGWADWIDRDENAIVDSLTFANTEYPDLLESGLSTEAANIRRDITTSMQQRLANAKTTEEVKQVIKSIATELTDTYATIAKENKIKYRAAEATFFSDTIVHDYLKDRMGELLCDYLYWKDLMLIITNMLITNGEDPLPTIEQILPGYNITAEINKLRTDPELSHRIIARGVLGGFHHYLRLSEAALVKLAETRNRELMVGGGLEDIHVCYRKKKRKKKKVSVDGDIEEEEPTEEPTGATEETKPKEEEQTEASTEGWAKPKAGTKKKKPAKKKPTTTKKKKKISVRSLLN